LDILLNVKIILGNGQRCKLIWIFPGRTALAQGEQSCSWKATLDWGNWKASRKVFSKIEAQEGLAASNASLQNKKSRAAVPNCSSPLKYEAKLTRNRAHRSSSMHHEGVTPVLHTSLLETFYLR
jgi:hypothetical protein